MSKGVRWLWRRFLAPGQRRAIRRFVRETPHRIHDLVPDLLGRLCVDPVPPARLRARVGLTSSRREFQSVGELALRDILDLLQEAGVRLSDYPRWLDFGCGSGRIARHLGGNPNVQRLWGVDVDREAVEWCRRNLPGEYATVGSVPPMALGNSSIDAVCAISVLTHMDEEAQRLWLRELHRVLRPGGLLVVTTHSPELTWTRPDLTAVQHESLARDGFLFAAAEGPFNDNSTFQSADYLRTKWPPMFSLRQIRDHGLAGYQDLSVWEKTAG